MRLRFFLIIISALVIAPLQAQEGLVIPTFGANGILDYGFANPFAQRLTSPKRTPDGRILLKKGSWELMMLSSDGAQLDSTFGSSGITTISYGDQISVPIEEFICMPDGRVLVLGDTREDHPVAIRLLSDGQVDTTFGDQGGVVFPDNQFAGNNFFKKIQLLETGNILIVSSESFLQEGLRAIRLLPNGDLDTSYGTNGMAISPIIGGADPLFPKCIHPDGRVLFHFETSQGTYLSGMDPAGNALFSDDSLSVPFTNLREIHILPSGRILLSGERLSDGVVQRLFANGSPDPSFGAGGVFSMPMDDIFHSLPLSDGTTLCVGSEEFEGETAVFFRLTSQGSIDPTFGTNGITKVPFSFWLDFTSGGLVLTQAGNYLNFGRLNSSDDYTVGIKLRGNVATFLETTPDISAFAWQVPSRHLLEVSNLPPNVPTSFQLADLKGRILKSGSWRSVHAQVSTADLVPGVYLLHLQTHTRRQILKFWVR
ncbi:MAG: hypothetical protein AAFV07_13360 [Bacteroidota bacterium]